MNGPGRSLRRHLARAAGAEPWVRLIVAGGLALVAGLWLVRLSTTWEPVRPVGLALVVLGVLGLGGGIWIEVEY